MIRKITATSARPFTKPIEALVVPMSAPMDRYRQEGRWLPTVRGQLPDSPTIDAFSLHGRYTYELGDSVDVYDIGAELIGRCGILAIRAVDMQALTDADLKLLGYDRARWQDEWGAVRRLGWLIEVAPILKAEES